MAAQMDDPETWSVPEEWELDLSSGNFDGSTRSSDGGDDGRSSVELRTEIEEELVHGVTLFASLSGWGKHWSKQSASSMYQAGEAYNLSFVTSQFRSFISHDWKTSGWLKFLALLWVFNSPAATFLTLSFSIFWGVLIGTGLVSDDVWCVFMPYLVYFIVLCFWQRLREWMKIPVVVFVDKLCIPQHDAALKAKGIEGLAAFLDRSQSLTILWSPRYFTRLWCIYELGSYLRHGKRPVHFVPVALPVVMLLMCIGGMLLMTPYELSFHNGGAKETLVRGSQGKIYWESFLRTVGVVAAVALMVLPCIFFLGIRVMHDLRKVPDQLQHFSVRSCECFCCSHHHRHPETGQDLVRSHFMVTALQGARRAQMPLRHAIYLACTIGAPGLRNAVQGVVQEAYSSGFEDAWAVLLAACDFLSNYFFSMLGVFLFYVWLAFEFFSLGAFLMKVMSRLTATLLTSSLMFVAFGSIWFLTVMVNAILRENTQGPFQGLMRIFWLLLAICCVRLRRA